MNGQERNVENQKTLRICWICGNPTPLETCKIDEHGLPVHEACHTLKLSLQNGTLSSESTSQGKLWQRQKTS
jgi:hypothetical protein